MPKKYKKKPIIIEAIQFTGENHEEVGRFAGLAVSRQGRNGKLVVKTLEGTMIVSPGDFVIRGIKGEYYPCKPDVFEATYEPV